MALIVPEESQRPYRFGMTLVCIGALFNWLGLADHHTKPVPAVRYIGVGLVASGAVLICMAMCFWMNSVRDDDDDESIDHVHVISLDPPVRLQDEKPPDYESVVNVPPPTYDDAIKLDPHRLLTVAAAPTDNGGGDFHRVNLSAMAAAAAAADTCAVTMVPDECDKTPPSCDFGGAVVAAAVTGDATGVTVTTAQQQQQSSTATATLAQAIRKSIRDIRKQLTNTVSDSTAVVAAAAAATTTTDVEQQQPQLPQLPQQPQQSQQQHQEEHRQQQQRHHNHHHLHHHRDHLQQCEHATAVQKSNNNAQTANDSAN